MKRRTMIATTAIFALTAAMLFAGVANAQQPTTATAQNWGGDGHNWGGDGHNWGGDGHNWGGDGGYQHWRR